MRLAGMSLKSSSFRAGTHTGPSRNWKSPATFSAAVANIDDVAIFHDVLFTFDVEFAGFLELHFRGVPHLRRGFSRNARGSGDQFTIFHHLGPDETPGEVRVNRVRRIRSEEHTSELQ